jgi:hypothetical protein
MAEVTQEVLDDIQFELELIGVPLSQQLKILTAVREGGFDPKAIDEKLVKMGFNPVFTIYDD